MAEPRVRFPEFNAPWKKRRFSEITYFSGKRNKSNLPLEVFSITNTSGFIAQKDAHDDFGYMKDADTSAYMIVEPYSFGYNPARINVGSLGYYSGEKKVIVSSLYEIFKTSDEVDDSFLIYWFKTKQFMDWIEKLQEGSVRQYFYYDKLCEVSIDLPCIEEQQKIADFLSSVDDVIAICEKELENIKILKKGMLQKMFPKKGESVPEVRFPGFTGDWEQRKLGDLADIVGGGTPSTSVAEYWDGDIDWYAPAEIADQIYVKSSQRKITHAGYDNCSAKMLPVGTVLFTSRAGIGKTAILSHEACTNQGFQSIVPHKDELDSYFIFSRSPELKKYGETVGAGSTFVEVSGKQMAAMTLMMPQTLDEQKRIGEFFTNLDNTITLHQRELDKWKELKKGLLQQMFV